MLGWSVAICLKVHAPRLQGGRPTTSQPCVMPAGFRLRNLHVSVLPAHAQEKIVAHSLARQYTPRVLARAVIRQAAAHGTANDDDGDEHVVGFSEIRLASGKLHTVPVCGGLTLDGFYSRVKAVLGLRWSLDVRLLCLDTETAGAPALLPRDHDVLARVHVSGHAFQAVIYDDVLERRVRHRQMAVDAVRRSLEYDRVVSHQMRTGAVERPATPDATDRSVSKRGWERKVQRWRMELKDLSLLAQQFAVQQPAVFWRNN